MDEYSSDEQQQPKRIGEILRERERLDQVLQDEFKKEVTILFTDICDYTEFVDSQGDINGRALIQKYNDIVRPLIAEHNGTVVDATGDGLMASFRQPEEAVGAAVSVQSELHAHNGRAGRLEEIHIRIGINTGEALVDEDGVAGDVVNVASRIEAEASRDGILISGDLYGKICTRDDLLCRFHSTVAVKGKPEPLRLYRVIWRDEDILVRPEPKIRGLREAVETTKGPASSVLHIDITRLQDTLKISAYEQIAGEESTIRNYEEMPAPMDKIGGQCREMVEALNRANSRGRITSDVLGKLRDVGRVLSDDLFPPAVKDKINGAKAEHLILNLDDQLVQIPWELLNDGHQFLCQRFGMGRLVRTRQSLVGGGGTRMLAEPLRMLILSDPRGDLAGAYSEGTQIRDDIDAESHLVNVSLRSGDISPDYIREKIRNFDLVHFAGHSDYSRENPSASGWRLTTGHLTAQDIMKMAGTSVMPALIFSNACQSARTEEWDLQEHFQEEIFGLANAFILAGVKHYIGTFWEILDEPSRSFAVTFYRQLLAGQSIGRSIRQGRLALIQEYGEETIVWASYLLYGDPAYSYIDEISKPEGEDITGGTEHAAAPIQQETVRSGEEIIDFGDKEIRRRRPLGLISLALLSVLAAVLLWGWPGFLRQGAEPYKAAILTHFDSGNYEEALEACRALEEKHPDVRMGYLIKGDILMRGGGPEEARSAYREALTATEGTDVERARALRGLGRVASIQKQIPEALDYYRQATALSPTSVEGYLSQAVLLDGIGSSQEAMRLLARAQVLSPDNGLLMALTNQMRRKMAHARDQERSDRIDGLVKELLERVDSPPVALPSDSWTSSPLTLWVVGFHTEGYSLLEGEDQLLVMGITDHMVGNSRLRLVERALQDRMMAELKLGSSRLADPSAALSLGRILAAKLMLTGGIVHAGAQTQISMRLIETETGEIVATAGESFGSAVPVSLMADRLSDIILAKVRDTFPIRGRIVKVEDDAAELNIGRDAGLMEGQRLSAVGEDLVLEIVSTSSDSSAVKVVEGTGSIRLGLRVEALP